MLAITNAHILTISHGEIENGTILIDEGKIAQVGTNVIVPEDADIMDVKGAYVMPGLIDAHTAVGLKEEGMRWEGDDRNENTRSPIMPHLSALDGFNPEDEAVYDAMENGITTVLSAPGTANVIGGQAAIFKMQERATADDLFQGIAGMQAALGQDPKGAWREMKKMPSTRMGTAYVLREALYKAKDYLGKLERSQANPDKAPERDLQSEALVKVLKGELPLFVHAHRSDDIMTAIRIAKEFGLRLVLTTATEAHKLAKTIKEEGMPVILGPISAARMSVETAGRTIRTPALLHEAGVKFALTTNHPETPLLTLTMQAGLAVRGGLCPQEALKAITLYPAEILGVADRVGSIEVGKDADLAIWDGHPLKVRSNVLATFVKGELVFHLDCHCCCEQ